jgi:hypothetical protein
MSQVCPKPSNSSSFSLRVLFFAVTAVAIFLGLYQLNSLAALLTTLIVAPALIRTTISSELHRRSGQPFLWTMRSRCFLVSIGLVLVTIFVGTVAFVFVSVVFGLFGLFLGFAAGVSDMAYDTAIVGTAGGMIWGMAGSGLAITFTIWKYWSPNIGQ